MTNQDFSAYLLSKQVKLNHLFRKVLIAFDIRKISESRTLPLSCPDIYPKQTCEDFGCLTLLNAKLVPNVFRKGLSALRLKNLTLDWESGLGLIRHKENSLEKN